MNQALKMTSFEFRSIREYLGLSQQDMAELLGYANGRTVRYWESGKFKIPGTVKNKLWGMPWAANQTR